MTAAQERAFDEQAAAAGRALWPGQIRMAGVTYDVSLTRNPIRLRWMDGDAAGVREVAGVQVELAKSSHPAMPKADGILEDLGDGGRLYRILRIGGRGEQDSVWYLEAAVEEGGGA